MARTLLVKLLGDSSSLERAFKRSEQSATKFQKSVGGVDAMRGRLLKTTVAGIGAAAVFGQLRQMTEAASSLNEEVNKSAVVFGSSQDAILAWSKGTATAFGISQRAALGAASGFGQILQTSGVAQSRSAELSRSLVELAGDLSSFNNISTDDALEKLRAGLVGEAEPLRVLGVQLSESRVQQEAYRSGIAKTGAKLTDQQKVLARLNIIFQDTKKAQGDAARTSESFANKQRQLQAKTEELRAAFGQGLLPMLTTLVSLLIKAADAATALRDALRRLPGGTHFKLLDLFPKSGVSTDFVANLKRQSDQLDAVGRGGGMDQRMEQAQKRLTARAKATAAQRNEWWDAMIGRKLDRVQDITSLKGQLSSLKTIAGLIAARIAATKDITRKLNLEDRLLDVQRRMKGVREAIAARTEELRQERIALAREAAERRRLAAERRREARNAAQFRALGLTATGEERAPGIRALSAQLRKVTTEIAGTPLARTMKRKLAGIRRVLSGEFGVIGRDVRLKVRDILDGIDEEFKNRAGEAIKFRQLNANRFIRMLGLDLTLAQTRRLRAGLSTLGPNMTVPPGASAAFAGAGGIHVGTVNVHGVQNVAQFESELTRRAKRRARVRRGARG